MINRPREIYTASDLTALITCLSSLGFSTAELDLILADQSKLIALRHVLSKVPEALDPAQKQRLFRSLIITLSKNFELFKALRQPIV